jgi:hypothetical protein
MSPQGVVMSSKQANNNPGLCPVKDNNNNNNNNTLLCQSFENLVLITLWEN